MDKQAHEEAIKAARAALFAAESAYEEWKSAPEQNVFESVEKAEAALDDRFRDVAHEDCEGAGNCGADEYTQVFMVDGQKYLFTAEVEYNRHDKTYYYVEDFRTKVEKLED